MIVRTFTLVFKNTTLWTSYYPDLMLIGSNEKLPLDFAVIRKNFEASGAARDLGPHGILRPEAIFSSLWLESAALQRLVQGAQVNHDNRPILEFSAPKNLYRSSLRENFSILNRLSTRDYTSVSNLNPPLEQNADFFSSLAMGFVTKRFMDQAQWALERAKTIAPEDPDTLLAEVLLSVNSENKERAKEVFEKVILLEPNMAEAHYQLGVLYQERGNLPAAAAAFQETVRLEPGKRLYLGGLAGLFIQTTQVREAVAILNRMIEIEPDDFDSWTKRAVILFKIGSFEEKLAAGKAFIAKYSRFGPVYEWLGEALEAEGHLAEAFELYETLSFLQPEKAGSYLSLARICDKMGRRDDMKKHLGKAIDFDPTLAQNPEIIKALNQ